MEKFHWLKKLSEITGVKEDILVEEMAQLKSVNEQRSITAAQFKSFNLSINQPLNKRELICQRILALASTQKIYKTRSRIILIICLIIIWKSPAVWLTE